MIPPLLNGSTAAPSLAAAVLSILIAAGSVGATPVTEACPPDKLSSRSRLNPAALDKFDEIMRATLYRQNLPGGSLAIAVDGKLVYARAFGLAVVAPRQPFTPETRSTLASVSKTICALAVLKLVDAGKLHLDDKVYDALGCPQLPRPPADRRIYDVTVRQLLHHSGGWRRNDIGYSTKLMRRVAGGSTVPYDNLLREAFCQPLDYKPGSQCHYSNFQFAILRRIVERSAQEEYVQFVKRTVLAPAGITDMAPEGAYGGYVSNEAHRYSSANGKELPGGRRHMMFSDVTGSWVGSTVDMARLLTAIDGSRVHGYLPPYLYRAMLAAPPPPVPLRSNGRHFGLGLDTAYNQCGRSGFSKNGGVAGARAYIEHLPNNVNFAILLNGSGSGTSTTVDGPALPTCVAAVRTAIQGTTEWPKRDLFNQYR